MKTPVSVFLLCSAGLAWANDDALRDQANVLFGPLPAEMPGSEHDTLALIELGEKLYMDTRLSENNTQSCNSCHNVVDGGTGVDNLPVSVGAFGDKGGRNAPTVWNAGFQISQFWDGRAADLFEQAKGPVLNPIEMAMPSEAKVVEKLSGLPEYQVSFKAAYGEADAINYDNIAHAIAAFERTLITSDRFDQWLHGDDAAMSSAEKQGLRDFIGNGCASCHNGATLGGQMYQKTGLVKAYENQSDLGRFEVTGKEADKMVFKVPMLRDIARTAPYYHDGSVETLEEAVQKMGWLQLGREMDEQTVNSIVTFLNALTHEG